MSITKVLVRISLVIFFLSPLISHSQDLSNYTYSSFTSNTAGTFAGIGITMTNSGGTFEQDQPVNWTSGGILPSGYSNLANRSAIALKETDPTNYSKKTITFASNIWRNTLFCIEDIDANEDVRITFKDAQGNVINPNSTNITQLLPTSNPPTSTTTSTNINLVQNLSSPNNNLADPVVMLKLNLSTVRSIEIEARNSPNSNLGFYFAHPTPNLPVDLIHFDVHAANNHSASIHWATASEINNSHFEIERSYDGRNFETNGEVSGNGNSQHRIDYSYTDVSVSNLENTVFYRLKQVDFDGTSEYSDIRVVRFGAVGSGIDFSAYPNPLTDELSVMVSLSNGEAYQIEITDLQGAKVHHENHTFTNGIHKLNTSEWDSGIYILQVATDQGTQHIKVMKK